MNGLDFFKCFDEFQLAHYRDAEGYKRSWYDRDNVFETIFHDHLDYHIDIPAKDGDLYISAETYFINTVSTGCYPFHDAPLMSMFVYKTDAVTKVEELFLEWFY